MLQNARNYTRVSAERRGQMTELASEIGCQISGDYNSADASMAVPVRAHDLHSNTSRPTATQNLVEIAYLTRIAS